MIWLTIDKLLSQIKAYHRAGDKPLLESMTAYFTDAYIRQSATMISHIIALQTQNGWQRGY